MTSRNGEVAKLRKLLESQGWTVNQSGKSCHFHVRDPENNALVSVFASSTSSVYLRKHVEGDIRRYQARKQQERKESK